MSQQPKSSSVNTDALVSNLLKRYLDGTLSEEEKRNFEEFFTEDEFAGDAIEGLIEIRDPIKLEGTRVRLHKMISKKIKEQHKISYKTISFPIWLILSIIILLLIMLAGYVMIKKLSQ